VGGSDGKTEKLRNKELRNLYASPNIIGVTISRRVKWVRHVTQWWEMRSTRNF